MTGKIIILFLLSVNFVLRMDKEHIKRGQANLLDLEMPDPGQSSPAVPSSATSKCSWWPFCESDTFICGGTQKSLCNVYGTNGSKQSEAPSESALSRAVIRANRLNHQIIQDRTCPWGCGRTVLCGGTKRACCEKFGKNGTHKHERPSDEELKLMRQHNDRKRK